MKDSPAQSMKIWFGKNRAACTGAAAAFLCGILTHLYILTNKFYNYFEMGNIFSRMPYEKSDVLPMGRVFMPFITSLSSYYSQATINGLLCMAVLAFSVYMLIDCLRIRSRLHAAAAGCIAVTFPGVASYLSYGVNSDLFCISICLAVMSVWLTQKYRKGFLAGSVCLCVSIGCYQPFLSVAVAVVFGILFLDVLRRETTWKELVLKALKYLAMMVAGFVLYYVVLKIALKATGITMGDYHGINEMTSFTLKGIAKGFVYTYLYFLSYFFTTAYCNGIFPVIANCIAAALMLVFTVFLMIRRKKGKMQPVLLLMLLPLGVNAAPFLMADRVGNGVDNYMIFSVVVTYFLLLAAAEECERGKLFSKERLFHSAQWGVALSCAVVILSGFYVCNMAYHRLEAVTKQVTGLLERVAYRIEETQEWQEGTPVYFAGNSSLFNEYYAVSIPEFDRPRNVSGTELKPWYSYEALVKYMKEYLHFPLVQPTKEQIALIESSEELTQMPVYPLDGSIAKIDGVLVVKFADKEE
ncbi:MAG: glucosyltransferase domain-containing protein [Clostridium sp.]|nr:glucosyltransferase domain-containing protein [Clostridium sp.]